MQIKHDGFSLVELVIALGISTILGLGIATFLRSQQVTVYALKSSLVMHQLAKTLEEAAGRPDVVAFSALYGKSGGSSDLRACLGQVSGAPCLATQAINQRGMELILPFTVGNEIESTRLEKNTIAGTEEHPVWYTLEGKKCAPTASLPLTCVLQASAYFWASCPANLSGLSAETSTDTGTASGGVHFSAQCEKADAVHLRIHVVHVPKGSHSGDRRFPSIPSDSVFYENPQSKSMSATGAISTATSFIPSVSGLSFSCPINYTVTQILDGKPKCECLYPFQELESDFITLCTSHEQKCGFNERYRGTDENGTIICRPITCHQQDLGSSCSVGGWIQKVIYNKCTTDECKYEQFGGGCAKEITCTGSIVCCYDTNR